VAFAAFSLSGLSKVVIAGLFFLLKSMNFFTYTRIFYPAMIACLILINPADLYHLIFCRTLVLVQFFYVFNCKIISLINAVNNMDLFKVTGMCSSFKYFERFC